MAEVIALRDIHKTFRVGSEKVHALQGVSLTVARGEFVAVMGPSGSGKSTLMHIIGLLDRPSSGTYHLEGEDVSDLDRRRQAAIRNQRIGFVFQQFSLLPRTTVLDNVLLPTVYGRDGSAAARAREVLDQVGLGDRVRHRSNQLSGGQVQRVAIARALVMRPSLILADEPTGNLDSKTSRDILELLQAINGKGATLVLITHEAAIAQAARRVVRLHDGQIVEEMTP
ncbi:MAG TPA: macrolide ABC transporter ATP-binding protein [Clostridiales bacterium UBA8153]|nr:macrolide ABC transporter ATP-binding protein [Clostridiales bacterium UBA8153]